MASKKSLLLRVCKGRPPSLPPPPHQASQGQEGKHQGWPGLQEGGERLAQKPHYEAGRHILHGRVEEHPTLAASGCWVPCGGFGAGLPAGVRVRGRWSPGSPGLGSGLCLKGRFADVLWRLQEFLPIHEGTAPPKPARP